MGVQGVSEGAWGPRPDRGRTIGAALGYLSNHKVSPEPKMGILQKIKECVAKFFSYFKKNQKTSFAKVEQEDHTWLEVMERKDPRQQTNNIAMFILQLPPAIKKE